ncbi:MAG: TIGR02530 family flagellar biosynthesis protein [Bacillota bacterium]
MKHIDLNGLNQSYQPTNNVAQKTMNGSNQTTKTLDPRQLNFESMMNQKLAEQQAKTSQGELSISKHATTRMEQRGMEMSTELMFSLNEAMDKVRMKGARDTVMIAEQGAFIVNVPNNVIVTAITKEELKENVFTNIDSAVLI